MRLIQRFPLTSFITSALLLVFMFVYTGPRPASAQSTFAPNQGNRFKAFSTSANLQFFTAGNSAQYIYICSLIVNNGNAAAQGVSIVEGTGSNCATNTVAVIGNSTAAGGLTLATNSGQNIGGGIGPIAKTAVAGDNVCIFTGAGPIGGAISAVQANQ